ncbi:hypothetical protein B0H34DRAFT_724109 [Crassisporium funariophilum]|nr:hypothetical protein B0H34DRAFT_724109 [Crassisporium funariophilum]
MSVRFQTTSQRCTWLETTHRRPAIAVTTRRRSCSLREPLLANVHPRDDTSTSGNAVAQDGACVAPCRLYTTYQTGMDTYASCHRECHNMTYQMPSQQEGYNDIPTSYHHLTYHHSKLSLSPTRLSPDSPYMANMTYQLPSQQEGYDDSYHHSKRYYIILTDSMLLPTFG